MRTFRLMSGPSKVAALQFLPEGAAKPSRVIYVRGFVPLYPHPYTYIYIYTHIYIYTYIYILLLYER